MDFQAHKTTNHDKIIKWVTSRRGKPVRFKTESHEPGLGDVAIYFPEVEERKEYFMEISWDEFLQTFEQRKLVFLYKDFRPDGEFSHYYNLIRKPN